MTDEMTLKSPKKNPAPNMIDGRVTAIDRNRGIVVFCMIFFQMIKEFPAFGGLVRIGDHDVGEGITFFNSFTLADLVMPMFIFSIALTYKMTFQKRMERVGRKDAYLHFVSRYLCLIGLGSFMRCSDLLLRALSGGSRRISYVGSGASVLMILLGIAWLVCTIKPLRGAKKTIGKLMKICLYVLAAVSIILSIYDIFIVFGAERRYAFAIWNTLEPIGFAGLAALVTVEWKSWQRALLGLACIVAYSFIHTTPENIGALDLITHGGFAASLDWIAMLLFAMTITDFYHKNKNSIFIAIPITAVIGIGGYLLYGGVANLGTCSPGYVCITLFTNVLFFSIAEVMEWFIHSNNTPMNWWGKRPLLMYALEFFVVNLSISMLNVDEMSLAASIVAVAVLTALLTAVAYYLNKKKITVRF